jgi:hypothetical protein
MGEQQSATAISEIRLSILTPKVKKRPRWETQQRLCQKNSCHKTMTCVHIASAGGGFVSYFGAYQ